MNKLSKYLVILCAVLFTPLIYAQQTQTQTADAQKRLAEARARLEQAAREVAELSGQVYGRVGGPTVIFREIHQGKPRAMLGVNISGVPGDGKSDGVKILGVGPGSPADNAGLRAGDTIISIDGESLTGTSSSDSSEKLLKHMAGIEPGKSVTLAYRRNGKTERVKIKTADMRPMDRMAMSRFGPGMKIIRRGFNGPRGGAGAIALNDAPFFSGPFARQWGDLELAPLSQRLGKYFGTDSGVLVIHAPRDDKMKLEDGDVILSIDGRKPNDPGHAMQILRSYATGEKLTMEVMRDKRHRKVEMTIPEAENTNFMFRTAPAMMGAAPIPPTPQRFIRHRQPPAQGMPDAPPAPPRPDGANTPI